MSQLLLALVLLALAAVAFRIRARSVGAIAPVVGVGLVVLALVAAGDDDLLWLHVAGHLAFFAALLAHVGLVLGRGLLPRMLPGRVSPPAASRAAPSRTYRRPR